MSADAQSGRDVRDGRGRSRLEVQRFADAQLFLDETGPFLAEREAEHNLMFGIAATLIIDPSRWHDRPYLGAIKRDGEVVAAALMTPPWNVVMSTTATPGSSSFEQRRFSS